MCTVRLYSFLTDLIFQMNSTVFLNTWLHVGVLKIETLKPVSDQLLCNDCNNNNPERERPERRARESLSWLDWTL